MATVALITCLELSEPDPDEELLVHALRQAGVDVALLAWDDPNANPAKFDLCVVRSCWNYYERPDAFLRWIDSTSAASPLVNPANVIRWNSHKTYLQDLERAGIPVIPTSWIDRGNRADLQQTMHAHGWDDVVIKPAISAGSYRTKRFGADELAEGQAFLESLARDRDAMVQRYIPAVESPGERAIISIDGELTHTIVKRPRLVGDDERVSGAVAISDQDRAIAGQALACVDEELLYARVDVVEDSDGKLLVSELELIEPSLFLLQCPAALARFADAIAKVDAGLSEPRNWGKRPRPPTPFREGG